MKIISIKEPWASLIVNGYKEYEFRKWKTNFRGNVYIHASKSIEKDQLPRFEHLNLEYRPGKIIGCVKVTDCIKVDKDFEDKLISENELVYGASYNRTGYAFKLEKIQKIDVPIRAKGQLGFWDYYNEFEVMELMQDIEYGWMVKDNKKHFIVDEQYSKNYRLQSPQEIMKNKVGICWDQVETKILF